MLGANNNPRELPKQHFTAHIEQYPTFSAYLLFYEHSIERLFSDVSEGNGTPDAIALPMLFLMRHAIELGYKFSLFHLCKLNSTPFDPKRCGHSLKKLHKELHIEFSNAEKHNRVSPEDRKEFHEYFSVTEKKMLLFDNLDARSENLRYPDKHENKVFPVDVNLLEMKDAFDEAMILLDTIVDVIARPRRYWG
jgi:hypothetical protein